MRMDDQELGRRFAELRGEDEASAPAFDAAMDDSRFRGNDGRARGHDGRARGNGRRLRRSTLILAAAAIALVAAGVFTNGRGRNLVSAQAVAEWRPNTDVLLPARQRTLFEMMPPLSTSVLDTVLRWNTNQRITR